MKKILVSAIIAVFFAMMPPASFATTAISDSELDSVVAQEGITIQFGEWNGDDSLWYPVVINSNGDPSLVSLGDPNGFTGYDATGSPEDYASAGYIGFTLDNKPELQLMYDMTVDVGANAGVSKIKLGLPEVLIQLINMNFNTKLDSTAELNSAQPALGTFGITVGAFNYYCLLNGDGNYQAYTPRGQSITFATHITSHGVSAAFDNVTLSFPALALSSIYLSDSDGWGAASDHPTAGYFGFYYFRMLTDGQISSLSGWNDVITLSDALDLDLGTDAGGTTAVHIGLPTTKIGPVDIQGNLRVSSTQGLNSGTLARLGLFKLIGFGTTLTGGLTIASH